VLKVVWNLRQEDLKAVFGVLFYDFRKHGSAGTFTLRLLEKYICSVKWHYALNIMLWSQMQLTPYDFSDLQIDGEFDNRPGTGRFLRILNDIGRAPYSARPMSFYFQWPYKTPYGRRGIVSRT